MKELFIDRGITQSRAAIYKDGKLSELYIENIDHTSINGNVYKGRVENIIVGLNAAFINIGTSKNAMLHFENENELKEFKRGQEIIVQVIREGIGDKGPRVSTVISIPGKYTVLLPGDNYIGVSKKIDNEGFRRKMKAEMEKNCEDKYGVIVRTEGLDANLDEVREDYLALKEMWKGIERKAQYMKVPQLLFNSKDFYEFILREYVKNDVDKIYLNRASDVEYVKDRLIKIDRTYGNRIIYEEYNFLMQDKIEKEIEKAGYRKLELKSGGFLIIDYTEAFTCIDVNSGNFIGEDNSEDTILKVNLEACKEIGNAIRLRNISGIILIDFIDMKREESKQLIINTLEKEFIDDKYKLKIYGFTRLGILETARPKKGIRLLDFIYRDYQNKAINPSYCLKLIENKCNKLFRQYKRTNFNIDLASSVYDEIHNNLPEFIHSMKSIYGITISFRRNQDIKDFLIEKAGTNKQE